MRKLLSVLMLFSTTVLFGNPIDSSFARTAPKVADADQHPVVWKKKPRGLVGNAYYVSPDAVQLIGIVGYNAIEAAGLVTGLIEKTDIIQLIINSPGGSVTAGETLMSAMDMARASGVEVECIVVGASYSMGWNVLGSCTRVYATPAATFLFHPVKAMVDQPLRAIDAFNLARDLDLIDGKYIAIASRLTRLPDVELKQHYYAETMWTMETLHNARADGFLTPVAVVKGLPGSALLYPGRDVFEREKSVPMKDRRLKIRIEAEIAQFILSGGLKK